MRIFGAGLRDFGKGSIGIYHYNSVQEGRIHICFQVSQSNRVPIDYIASQLSEFRGIRIGVRRTTRQPLANDPYVRRRIKPQYLLTIQRAMVVHRILNHILPRLRFRQEQVKKAISDIESAMTTAKQRCWENDEDEFLRANYGKMSSKSIASALRRTVASVHSRATVLGTKCKCTGWAFYWQSKKRQKSSQNLAEKA